MGIAQAGALMLLVEAKERPFSGSILQLGRQDIYFSYEDLQKMAQRVGVPLRPLTTVTKRKNPYFPNLDAIDDVVFFASLGFDTVHSLDASDFEQSTFVHDLNLPIPRELHDQYDVVFDGGTSEHVFHTPQLLANIHSTLRNNGRVIHDSPTHNYVDHGFFMFSPTLFHDYYLVNHYEIVSALLLGQRTPLDHFADPFVVQYTPGCLDQFTVGGLSPETFNGCALINTFFVARKNSQSTTGVHPQQGYYRRVWNESKARDGTRK